MKALVKYADGPGNLEIRDVEEPKPGHGEVKIEVKVAGICGSDIHIYHSDIAIPVNPPVTIGHEFAGEIVELGEGVEGLSIGDRVVSETAYQICNQCDFCKEGYYNLCVERKTLGYWFNGVFTKYTIVPQEKIHLVSEKIDLVTAAMTEPLACVVHAVYDLCKIIPGDLVLVVGPGAIGVMAAQVAKAHGAFVIVAGTNVDNERLKIAKELGADYVVNIETEDVSGIVNELSGGYGADVVLECSGSAGGIGMGLNLIKKRGHFTQIGLPGKKIEFDIEKICYKELHFSGSMGSRNASWRKALQLLEEGKVVLDPLASNKFSIMEWEKAFDMFEKKKGFKIFLLPVQS